MKKPVDTFDVRGVSSANELALANDLLAKTQLPAYRESIHWLEETGPYWPGFKREHTRVAYDGAELVGGLRILTLALRIGKARLKCGGIGWVSTKPSHRNRGVCRALMHDAHDYMKRNGYHVSLLFGVPDLYQKFGYVTAIPGHSIIVDSGAAPITKSRCRTRPVRPSDRTRLHTIHLAGMKDAPFEIERSPAYYETLFQCTARTIPYPPDWPATIATLDARGRVFGYFMPQCGRDELHIKEFGIERVEHCDALLNAALAHARTIGMRRVRFHVPPWHVFALRLREYESLHETQCYRNREGMVRFVDLAGSIRRMQPEWQERLRAAGFDSGGGSVHLPVPITDQDLCRLLVGFWSAEEWIALNTVHLSKRNRRILQCIFPARHPFVWPIDHF